MFSFVKDLIKSSAYVEPTDDELKTMSSMVKILDEILDIPLDTGFIRTIRKRIPYYCYHCDGCHHHKEWLYAYILLRDGINLADLQRFKDKQIAFEEQHYEEKRRIEEAENAQTKQALLAMVSGPPDDMVKLDRIVVDDLCKLERVKRDRLAGELRELFGYQTELYDWQIDELEHYLARAKQARGFIDDRPEECGKTSTTK